MFLFHLERLYAYILFFIYFPCEILPHILVSLTKVKKKTKESKKTLVKDIRDSVDTYANLFVFNVDNMRATKFVEVSFYCPIYFCIYHSNKLLYSVDRDRREKQH